MYIYGSRRPGDPWHWLSEYHDWLKAQAKTRMGKTGATVLSPAGATVKSGGDSSSISINSIDVFDEDDFDTIYSRVCNIESSVIQQSEELQRAKQLFNEVRAEEHLRQW